MNRQQDYEMDALYRTHVQALFSYALRLCPDREVAKDAVHDVFCRICEDERLRRGIINIRVYLLQAVRNRLIDMQKGRDVRVLPVDDAIADELPFGVHVSVEEAMIEHEERENLRRRVEQLMTALTDRQREIIYLRYEQELDYDEIARTMHITASSCRKLVHKAMSKLRKSKSGDSKESDV
ncbi:MAG: sigma-70 family RNA polymerase sigma factor [Tannerella sp.]|jgi:RNA polymerase sigma factor (sigma-70 family)|nr:sigma-70 family RNA polymerase sigma factor [Tannerella sp.]